MNVFYSNIVPGPDRPHTEINMGQLFHQTDNILGNQSITHQRILIPLSACEGFRAHEGRCNQGYLAPSKTSYGHLAGIEPPTLSAEIRYANLYTT